MEKIIYTFGICYSSSFGLHVSPILNRGAEFQNDSYNYIADIVSSQSDGNGNGLHLIKIYTHGKLLNISVGNWHIPSVIKMPFNWKGYILEMCMIDSQEHCVRFLSKFDNATFFSKKGFNKEIEGLFNKLIEFNRNYLNVQHYQILNDIEYYLKNSETHTNIGFYEYFQNLNKLIPSIKEISSLLNQEQYQNFITQVNKYIDYLNSIKIKYIGFI